MASYDPPKCLMCAYFTSPPQGIGSKAKCSKYPNGISSRIFYECGNCSKFSPKSVKGAKKSGKRKK